MKKFFANSQGQDLAKHSVLVGRLAEAIVLTRYGQASSNKDDGLIQTAVADAANIALNSGYLHDLGKVGDVMASYITSMQRTPTKMTTNDNEVVIEDGVHIPDAFSMEGKSFSFDNYPRHEEVSWLLITRFLNKGLMQESVFFESPGTGHYASRFSMMMYAVYWHHAKPLRSAGVQEANFSDAEKIANQMLASSEWLSSSAISDLKDLLTQIDSLASTQFVSMLKAQGEDSPLRTPAFKEGYQSEAYIQKPSSIQIEMKRTVIRSAVVTADRIVSSLSPDELDRYIELGALPNFSDEGHELDVLYKQIEQMEEAYAERYASTRTTNQVQAADSLVRISKYRGIACLQGPAGCGKTKIALQYLLRLKSKKRVFLFVPRTAIGESIFYELIENYGITAGVEFLSGSKKLTCTPSPDGRASIDVTPESRQGTGNIVITTIDYLCKTMLSHKNIDVITQISDSHVIFDEFHELVDIPAIALLFLEQMQLRKLVSTGTLLVSATPNPHLLKQIDMDERAVVKVPTFNTTPIELKLKSWEGGVYSNNAKEQFHPFATGEFEPEKGAFVICNTATVAQQASIAQTQLGKQVICFHSKFTPDDKSSLLKKILHLFGKQRKPSSDVLISGPIIQASFDITTRNTHAEVCHAEKYLQILGRNNRFADMDSSVFTMYYALMGKSKLANSQQLTAMHQANRTQAFFNYLSSQYEKIISEKLACIINLATVYAWYDEFNATEEAKSSFNADFDLILRESLKIFKNNDFDPIQYPAFKSKGKVKLSRNSLRGRSFYILPMRIQLPVDGTKARLSLLWNNESTDSKVLTDGLIATNFSAAIQSEYVKWTQNASKSTVISHVTAGEAGTDFLKTMTKKSARIKNWSHLKNHASDRDTPILVSKEKYNDNNLYYFEFGSLLLGLIKASNLEKIPNFSIKDAI